MVWTTGPSGEWCVPLWPLAAPGIERSEAERLDLKDGAGLGQRNGEGGLIGGPIVNGVSGNTGVVHDL